jgi:glycosyltransferase involved in cell wall biosynthesis
MSKTVAIIGSYAPSLLNFRGSLIKAMIGRGHRVVCVAPEIDAETADRLAALGAEVRPVDMQRAGLNPVSDLKTYRSLRRTLSEISPDVVIPYTIKPIVWGVLAAHSARVARIVPLITGLGYAFTGGASIARLVSLAAASVLYRMALSRAHIVLFQNPDDLALFRGRGLVKRRMPTAIVAGSGVDTAHYAPLPLPENTCFLMISRLLKNKGIREFAAAARTIKGKYPDVAIKLVGYLDGSTDSIGQAELDAMIDDGVEYLGQLADVRPAIALADVYVLPSYREGTPRSSLEAMAMGRAVITTDAPGCRETVSEGVNGLLVPVGDAVRLAQAMERFIQEPGLAAAMGRESRRIATEKYDVNTVNADIMRHAGL